MYYAIVESDHEEWPLVYGPFDEVGYAATYLVKEWGCTSVMDLIRGVEFQGEEFKAHVAKGMNQ